MFSNLVNIQLAPIGAEVKIENEAQGALANKILAVFPKAQAWMISLADSSCGTSHFSFQDCVLELNRRKAQAMKSNVKGFIEKAYTGKTLILDGDEIKSESPTGGIVPMSVVAGYVVPTSMADKPSLHADIALEVAVESMLMAQVSDPTPKHNYSTFVDTALATEMCFPVHNLSLALSGVMFKASDIDNYFRNKEKTDRGCAVEYAKGFFPKQIPGLKEKNSIVWNSMKFNFEYIPSLVPKRFNQNFLHSTIHKYRLLRGKDNGRRSMYTKGYYTGYCDNAFYRAYVMVADLERLVRTTGERYLRINKVDKLFTDIVLYSLVSNGWVIEVLNAGGLSEYDMIDCYDDQYVATSKKKGEWKKIPNKKKETVVPGVYRKVRNCRKPFFVHYDLGETTVVIKSDPKLGNTAELTTVVPRLTDILSEVKSSNTIAFCSVYYRNEFVEQLSDHFFPTAHAHSGFVLFCSLKNKTPLDFREYCIRVIKANAYKNYFVYNRETYFQHDPYAVDFPVRISAPPLKKDVKMGSWTDEDFDVEFCATSIVPLDAIDYDSLKEEAPIIAAQLSSAELGANVDPAQIELLKKFDIEAEMKAMAIANDEKTMTNSPLDEDNIYGKEWDWEQPTAEELQKEAERKKLRLEKKKAASKKKDKR